jgi:hypothetical protein
MQYMARLLQANPRIEQLNLESKNKKKKTYRKILFRLKIPHLSGNCLYPEGIKCLVDAIEKNNSLVGGFEKNNPLRILNLSRSRVVQSNF